MPICVLVLAKSEAASQLTELLINDPASLIKTTLIKPKSASTNPLDSTSLKNPLENQVISKTLDCEGFDEIPLLNPKLVKKKRQQSMALWLMPFGFIAGLTFSQMTGLETFSGIGLGEIGEPIIGSILGMGSGWIGSYTAAASVGSENEDETKGLQRRNQEGFWLLILETPPEIDLPWQFIKNISPLETVRMSEQ